MSGGFKYKYFFICVAIWLPIISLSQNLGNINGVVLDKQSPVEFVSVILTSFNDSTKALKVVTTDSIGHFKLKDVPFGDYLLKFQLIGYLSSSQKLNLNESNKQVAPVQLQPDSKMLDGVEVVSQKDLIKKTPQGFIINAKDNLTQAGGTATDLLKNTPTIVVDPEGGITIRGKTPLILINGRNSNLSSTDRIPASSIESIEIINNPSAQYDADADGGIINIKLKKNTAKGTNGSVGLGAGYGAAGRLNSSFIINHSTGKWNFGLAYDNRFAGRTRKIHANRTAFDSPNQYYLIQNRFDDRLEETHNAKLNIDYSPDQRNSFSFEAIGNFDSQHNIETLTSTFRTQSDSFNTKNSRRSDELGVEKVAEVAFNYNRKFSNPKRALSANISSSYNYETENTDITTQSLLEDSTLTGNPFLQRTYNYQPSSVSNLRFDYAHPVTKKGVLETGYKGIMRLTNADFQSQYLINNEFVRNPLASNVFNFQEQIHAAYLQFRSYIGKEDSVKWKYDIGIRFEQVFNEGNAVSNNIHVKRDYLNYFPTANLLYYPNQNDYFKLSFSRRINRPSLGQLNPFTDVTDSLSQHSGNPYLKPELINSAEFGYNKEWKKLSISTNLFYRYATNIIRPYLSLQSNGVSLTFPTNYGNSETYGLESIISAFPVKFWNVNFSGSLYQQNINGSNVNPDIANNVFSWYGKIINNFSLWKGSKLQIMANYNSPIGTPQGQKIEIYYADLGFQQKILKGKGGLGIVVTDVFNTQINGYTAAASNFSYNRKFKIDTRAIMLTFAYSFGTAFKEELIENKFSNE
ncbi:MAG: TonB-dependent receptor [Bacteroidia bacterium]|nr:TonB-dependent receptor [Bacteroidia bacterium]